MPDDKVVLHADLKHLPYIDERTCHSHIVRAGSRVAPGMIVGNDDGRSISLNGGSENLGGSDLRGIHRTLVHRLP